MTRETKYCTFFLDSFFLGIAVERVQEVIRPQEMTPIPLTCRVIRGLINLRGQIVTAIDLRELLDLDERQPDRLPMNVVIGTEEGAVSLLVDEIHEVIAVDESTFAPPPENLRSNVRDLIKGVHKLDERLMLLLDVDAVLDASTDRSVAVET